MKLDCFGHRRFDGCNDPPDPVCYPPKWAQTTCESRLPWKLIEGTSLNRHHIIFWPRSARSRGESDTNRRNRRNRTLCRQQAYIEGKTSHDESVFLLSRAFIQWWLWSTPTTQEGSKRASGWQLIWVFKRSAWSMVHGPLFFSNGRWYWYQSALCVHGACNVPKS